MDDKALLGARYKCFQCATLFYDLNRPTPSCPECGTDQRDAPVRDIKGLLSGRGRPRPKPEPDEDEVVVKKVSGDGDDDDDEFGDLGIDDDDDGDEDDDE